MANNPIVFEVLIHRVEADEKIALLLQQQLRKDGIRAIVTDITGMKVKNATIIAKHLICLIDFPNYEKTQIGSPHDQFDFVFIADRTKINFSNIKTSPSYRKLIKYLNDSRKIVLLSSNELRLKTLMSYEKIAGQFTDVWFDNVPGEAIETFLKHLPSGSKILDAGCGPGHHSKFMKKAGYNPVGLDFSPSMIAIAKTKNFSIPFEIGDILTHSLPPSHFDGVWSAVALNHIPSEERNQALSNLASCLKIGGVIGLNFQVGRQSEIVDCPQDQRFFEYPEDENTIKSILEELGFKVVATQIGITNRNVHNLKIEMRFVTLVAIKLDQSLD